MATAHYDRTLSGTIVNAIRDAFDAGATGATINFYTASMPSLTATGITSQILLGTCTCSTTSAPNATAGLLTLNAITNDSSADNSGTATWARIKDSSGNVVMDVDVTVIGGGGCIQMVSTTIVAGGPIAFTSFTITMP
jgi:hypothetical protein